MMGPLCPSLLVPGTQFPHVRKRKVLSEMTSQAGAGSAGISGFR